MSRTALTLSVALVVAIQGCTSTDALDPTALNTPSVPVQPVVPALPAPQQPDSTVTPAAAPTSTTATIAALPNGAPARVVLATVVGAPTPATTPLSERLAARGSPKRFVIVPEGDPTATHTLKGFFSTSPEGRETIVYYVWDVVDAAGNRVHRFAGQVSTPGGEGWPSVTPAVMQTVADRTAEDLAKWLAK